MESLRHPRPRRLLVAIALLSLVWVAAPAVIANSRYDDGDVPFYARVEPHAILHTGDWAFVVFYRPPGCVPLTFNQLDFFDIPAASDHGRLRDR